MFVFLKKFYGFKNRLKRKHKQLYAKLNISKEKKKRNFINKNKESGIET